MLRRLGVALSLLVVTSLFTLTARAETPPTVEYLKSPATSSLALPFSDAVRVGNLLFLSGQIGNKPGTIELVPGGISAEARQALENIRAILEANRSSLGQVVKCTIFLADMRDWSAFNEVYKSFFSTNLPARSALGADGLALGAKVEVECIAVVPGADRN